MLNFFQYYFDVIMVTESETVPLALASNFIVPGVFPAWMIT